MSLLDTINLYVHPFKASVKLFTSYGKNTLLKYYAVITLTTDRYLDSSYILQIDFKVNDLENQGSSHDSNFLVSYI